MALWVYVKDWMQRHSGFPSESSLSFGDGIQVMFTAYNLLVHVYNEYQTSSKRDDRHIDHLRALAVR